MPNRRTLCVLVMMCMLLPASGLAADAQAPLILRNKKPAQPVEQGEPAPELPTRPGAVQPVFPAPQTQQGNTVIVLPPSTTQLIQPEGATQPVPGTTPPVQLVVPPTIVQPVVPGKVETQPEQPPLQSVTPPVQSVIPSMLPVAPAVIPTPEKPAQAEVPQPEKPISPADFLFKTKLEQQKTPEPKKEAPQKAEKPKPQKPSEKKPTELAKKPDEKPAPPKRGEALKIPESAKKDKNVDFLEGCWVGTRPEYSTKRIVTEKFCFDANGVGKRRIIDPNHAGTCVGATHASMGANGVLTMDSERMSCTSGSNWSPSTMTCEGEGERTPCTWVFKTTKGKAGGSQSYSINFVRE